jgi:O-antigen ligase
MKKSNFFGLLLFISIYYIQFSLNVWFSIKPYMIIVAISILYYFVLKKGKIRFENGYEVVMSVFVIYAISRSLFAYDLTYGIRGAVAIAFSYILYHVSKQVLLMDKDGLIRLLYFGSWIITLTVSLGMLLGYPDIYETDRGVDRLRGYIQDPNFFALFMTIPLFISFYYLLYKRKRLLFLLVTVLMILTFSRATYLSLVLPIVSYFIYVSYKSRTKILKPIAIIISMSILGFVFSQTSIGSDFVDNIYRQILLRFSESASTNARIRLINEGFSLIRKYPIFGVGLLNTRFYTYELIGNNYIHNTYLEVFVELGFLGGILYISMFASILLKKSIDEKAVMIKFIIITQMSMIFFLSATNNEVLYVTFALFNIMNRRTSNANTSRIL